MKIPSGSNSRIDRWAKYLVHLYASNLLVRLFIVPVVVGLPPTLITALYGNRPLREFIKSHFPQLAPHLASISTDYVYLLIVLVGLYPIILMTLGKELYKIAHSNGLNVEGLLALINSLDQIVGAKNKRFSGFASNPRNLTKETVFCTITDPDKQIAEIVNQICLFFNATREKKKSLIRVTLAEIKNGKIVNIPVYYPSDEAVQSSLELLNNPKSAILTAFKTKKMVLIPDIKKELLKPKEKRKFVDAGNEEDNNGSIICYPVMNGSSSVPFVISVHCDEAGYFRNEFKDLYEHSLRRFCLRLNVEYNLFVLKEKLCG